MNQKEGSALRIKPWPKKVDHYRVDFLSLSIGVMAAIGIPSQACATTEDKPFRILCFVFNDYETLDLHGPIEMLGHMKNVEITLVGNEKIVRSYQGTRIVTDTSTDYLTPCELFIVVGGIGTRSLVDNALRMEWIKNQVDVSDKVFSVCTGSALLAKAGVLDDINATTNKMAYKWVISLSDKVKWYPRAGWVDDGKFLTSSGVSAGTDAALYFVSQLHGMKEAKRIERLTEYNWNSDANNDPYAVEK
ncbi:Putative amidotransferase [Shewanella psychrophila]|uniref:Putative amidotransferase n=1 Tax=Shewanella psychrophila TaxID=225848 RepID=A0A1S6HJS0_9GAMM|nr:DJ-1/PfpI family protein [Shewanella psychrophila]AQS35744.1 Putative amidotransferase [Shewanella psychrophila]